MIKANNKLKTIYHLTQQEGAIPSKCSETGVQTVSAPVQSTSVQTDEVINFTPTIQIPDSSDHDNSSNKKSSNSCENDPTITFLTPNSDAVKLHRSLQKI